MRECLSAGDVECWGRRGGHVQADAWLVRGMRRRSASAGDMAETTVNYYRRETLHHLIVRALQRNIFTANQDIGVLVLGDDILLFGTVTHADLIPEAVALVEAVAPFVRVHCHLRVHRSRARASR